MVFSPWAGRMIDRHGERRTLSAINVAYIVALGGYALMANVWLACVFYVIYAFISPFSAIGAATYLRKIAVPRTSPRASRWESRCCTPPRSWCPWRPA